VGCCSPSESRLLCPRSEGAVGGARLVDPPLGAPGDERRYDHHGVDAAFIADEVDIVASIDEPRPCLKTCAVQMGSSPR